MKKTYKSPAVTALSFDSTDMVCASPPGIDQGRTGNFQDSNTREYYGWNCYDWAENAWSDDAY